MTRRREKERIRRIIRFIVVCTDKAVYTEGSDRYGLPTALVLSKPHAEVFVVGPVQFVLPYSAVIVRS